MKNILLIGGGGYVGAVIIEHFLNQNYKVSVLDNFIYDNQFALHSFLGNPKFNFFNGNLCNNADLEAASKDTSDVVILGGLVGDPITKKYPKEANQINSEGIINCIDFFKQKKINKLIFISTCSNYGLIPDGYLADEEFELNPLSLYAKAKVEGEKYLLKQENNANYTAVVLRFATAFGLSSRMRFDLTISEFTKEIFFDKELLVFDENTWRPYCHVRDFARLIEAVLNAENRKVSFEIFNAGGDKNNATKKMIVDNILKYKPTAKISYTKNGSDPRNYKVSFNKVKTILGFEPKYNVDDGIKELIKALDSGFFSDAEKSKNKYGNYTLKDLK